MPATRHHEGDERDDQQDEDGLSGITDHVITPATIEACTQVSITLLSFSRLLEKPSEPPPDTEYCPFAKPLFATKSENHGFVSRRHWLHRPIS
jgi:hypothetical protein